ncbi:MAG TPA: AAA family ATPase, partial [Myxococcota bacterium]|nr:AAA family ATPase [Myxococcota bacterium]
WDVARAGGVTLLMDYESNRRTVKTRMKAMGVEKGDAGRVAYWKVGGSLAPRTETASAFRDWVLEHRPQLVVLDSVSRAMSYMGLDENSNSDYATFDRVFAQPLVALGVTVLMIDHIGHDSPDRRGTPKPRGASNKTDHISGAMFFFRATEAWSRHRSGGGELVCVKDREGERAEGDVVADVVVTVAEGASPSVVFELVAPNVDAARREAEVVELPEWDMEKVSRFLEDFPEASFTVSTLRQSKKDGGAGVSGRNYQAVLEHLLAAGRVRKVGGRWQHVAPFRVGDTL